MQVAKPVDVQVTLLERVEQVLREAGEPVSRNYILGALKESGGSTNSPRLNRALQYLGDHKMVMEGSKGIQWTHSGSERIRRSVALGKRL
jgi:hypothetical protein